MITKFTGELKKGDFIALASDSYMCLGFYLGRGQNNSLQFYTFDYLHIWKRDGTKRKEPYRNFINNPREGRIIKYSPEFLTEENLIIYDKSIEILKQLKVIE